MSSLQKISSESLAYPTQVRRSLSISLIRQSYFFCLQQPRTLFGATKMYECSVHNAHRVGVFWSIILEHFTVLAAHKETLIRNFGVDSLTQIIGLALSKNPQDVAEHTVQGDSRSALEMQNDFLETLQELSRSDYLGNFTYKPV